ncbi:unnamed protein product [Camellia sinensis]
MSQVAPLEIHEENLIDVEEQLRFLSRSVQAAKISYLLPLLKDSFSSWIWNSLGILPGSIFPRVRCGLEMAIFPRVRCGLEMAILNAIAASEGSNLLNILNRETAAQEELSERSSTVQICALIDSNGTPKDVADIAAALVGEGSTLEPVQDEEDIIKFCEDTGLRVALDETIENIQENSLKMLAKFTHSGVVAVQDICMAMTKEPSPSIAHGLGTYCWLKEDITAESLNIRRNPCSGFIEASVDDAGRLLGNFQVHNKVILRNFTGEEVHKYQLIVNSYGFSFFINVHEIGSSNENNVLVFLHGFLGTGEDWITIMKAISGSTRCIAVDLPSHGRSKMQNHGIRKVAQERSLSIEVVADILQKLIQNITPGKVTLVGYSMGARIALYMALRCASKFEGAVIVSGSHGLKDVSARMIRKAKDDSRACSLINHGLELFLDTWYAGALWNSFRDHPHFKQMVASRLQHDDAHTLAKVPSDSSIGRQLFLKV